MEARHLDLAAELCDLAKVGSLFELLAIEVASDPADVGEALTAHRRKMQSMQSNPKYREQARFFIKHHQAIGAVLAEPAAYAAHLSNRVEDENVSSLKLAIDGILADGVVTAAEEKFVLELADNLGISHERCMKELATRAAQVGAAIPSLQRVEGEAPPPPLESHARAMGWWDAHFTRLLLDAIPDGAGEIVDVYCRMAWSALTLLPRRPGLKYLGIDRNAERIAMARSSLQPLGPRVALRIGNPEPLPLPDESVDIVLAVRALQTREDTRPVLSEAFRVLREGGRCILVEPDGLAEQFYFDGPLEEYTRAFRQLVLKAEGVRDLVLQDVPPIARGGMALGPQLFARLRHAGFTPREVTVHASQNLWMQPLDELARRLRAYPRAIARAHGIGRQTAEWQAIVKATDTLEAREGSKEQGLGGNVLPLFIAVGVKA